MTKPSQNKNSKSPNTVLIKDSFTGIALSAEEKTFVDRIRNCPECHRANVNARIIEIVWNVLLRPQVHSRWVLHLADLASVLLKSELLQPHAKAATTKSKSTMSGKPSPKEFRECVKMFKRLKASNRAFEKDLFAALLSVKKRADGSHWRKN